MVFMQLWFIFSLIFAIFVTLFAVMNADPVQIKLVFKEYQLSQALVIFISAALGAITVTFLGLVKQIRSSLKIKELSRQVKTLKDENDKLKEKVSSIENDDRTPQKDDDENPVEPEEDPSVPDEKINTN